MREWKATDNEWFPQIPADWRLEPLKKFTTTNTGITFTKADLVEEGNCVLSYGQVHAKNNPQTYVNPELVKYIPDSLIESKESAKVKQHDFIFADTSEDLAGCGNCIYIADPIELYAGYHTILLRNLGLECGRYFTYQFMSDEWRSQIRKRVKSVKLFSVTQVILNQTFVFIPPVAEQEAITEYLDKECEKIGRNIELLERKSDAYKRLRRSIINRAVTRGLNPDAPLKPSGNDWIGDIPNRWMIKRMKDIACFGNGLNIKKSDLSENGNPVVSYGQVHSKTNTFTSISESLIKFVTPELCKDDNCKISKGSFIVADTSEDLDGCGNMIYNDSCNELWVGYHSYSLNIIDEDINTKFLAYEFCSESWRCFIRSKVKAVKVYSITKGILKDVPVFIPPIEEQNEIVAYLDEKCGKIDVIIEKIGTQIERLKELKRSLINEVVTGKRTIINQ